MMQKNLKVGLYFALITALISGVANFLNKNALAVVKDSFVFTTAKNILVALVLTGLVLTPSIWRQMKSLKRRDWLLLSAIGVIGGSLPFVLFFKGLSITSAVQASFIHKTLFIWVTLLAMPLLKEKLTRWQGLALMMLLAGNLLLGGFGAWHFGWGEILVFLATLLWACEYIIAKKALQNISARLVAWARMFFGAIILIIWLTISGKIGTLVSLNNFQWSWIALMSLLLLGYVGFWYAALKRHPVSVVASILVLASPVTTLISAITTHQFGFRQLVGVVIVALVGIIIINLRSRQPEVTREGDKCQALA